VKPEFAVLQQQQIAKDLQKINRLLEGYPQNIAKLNEQFQTSWEKEKQKDSNKTPGYNRIKNIVWRNMNNSFW